ncbi:MAG: LysR family transcriptional regulator [Pseudomonadota bacterium]
MTKTKTELNELLAAEVFLQVVKARGFAKAAGALGRAPSTLTRAVADLERHLGVQLLTRTTRRIHLTEAGALYMQHAEAMLAARREARDAVASLTGGVPRGHLRVSMPVVVGERILGPHLGEFHRRYPELRLELDLSDRLMPLVGGGFDLALRIGQLPDSSLRAQRIGTVKRVLVASPEYLARQPAIRTPRDLPAHPLITMGLTAGPVDWTFYGPERVETIHIEGWLHTTSPLLAFSAACEGLGLARISEWVARDALRDGGLAEVIPEWACDDPIEGGPGLYAVYTQTTGVSVPLKSRAFVEWVVEVMRRSGVESH